MVKNTTREVPLGVSRRAIISKIFRNGYNIWWRIAYLKWVGKGALCRWLFFRSNAVKSVTHSSFCWVGKFSRCYKYRGNSWPCISCIRYLFQISMSQWKNWGIVVQIWGNNYLYLLTKFPIAIVIADRSNVFPKNLKCLHSIEGYHGKSS